MSLKAVEHARELDQLGFNVLPAIPRGKRPAIKWEEFQNKRTTPQLAAWFGGSKEYNFWVVTGQISGVVVLDCDTPEADLAWRKKLNGALDKTTCVKTARGIHYWFKIDGPFESWDGDKSSPEQEFNVRGDGTGVIAPPSIHEDGTVYAWVRPPGALQPVPGGLLKTRPETRRRGPVRGAATLSSLLDGLPDAPEKGNVWMTQVAGHYAKWIPHRDAFEATIRQVNQNLSDPIKAEDLQKLMDSIWESETEKLPAVAEDSGWLRGTGVALMTQLKDGEWAKWANFDISCQGVISDENDYRSYVVDILTESQLPQRDLLEPHILGAPSRLQIWLTSHGVNVVPPPSDNRKGSVAARIQRYLESQNAPLSRAAPWLGFNEGHGFLTHEGVISRDGLGQHQGVIPNPRLKGWAPYRYGFVPIEEARSVLNEVLTFQEEEICSIFGAWWAACFLKGQPDFGTSLWPYIALEAPSESGKTRGFFSLMIALTGNTEGHGESTTAALRDKVSAHRNGPVWIDDLSDVQVVGEILRQATSEGVRTKKGMDRTSQESVRLVAPIVVSGESMGAILTEKAQRDRAIQITAHSPVHRQSLHGNHPQWDDIQDLLRTYDGDLTKISGTLVSMALNSSSLISQFRTLRGEAGRHNDKIGVLRVGARVLAAMTGDSRHIGIVDGWCAAQEDLGAENTLTTSFLPSLLTGLVPTSPKGGPAIYIDNGIVFFSIPRVSEELRKRIRYGERASLSSVGSINAQRIALGIEGPGKLKSVLSGRIRGEPDQQVRYHELSPELSKIVLARADTTYATMDRQHASPGAVSTLSARVTPNEDEAQ